MKGNWKNADVIIVRDSDAAKEYGLRFSGNVDFRHIYVEHSGFINRCIKMQKYYHEPEAVKGMPGKPSGRGREGSKLYVSTCSASSLTLFDTVLL